MGRNTSYRNQGIPKALRRTGSISHNQIDRLYNLTKDFYCSQFNPYFNKILPGMADSARKTPFPALRRVDLRILHADKQCSRVPLNFLVS